MAEEVRAPLAGKVLSLAVEVGSQVEEDDEVLVIEALNEIKIKAGDQVEEDDLLVSIE